jgi:hypothetical protein
MIHHAEAAANTVIGQALACLVLLAFGVPLTTSLGIQITMFIVSYFRAYAIRCFFARLS